MTRRRTHFSINILLGAGHSLGAARISGMRLLSLYLPSFLCPLWIFSCPGEGIEAWNRSCLWMDLCLQLPVPGAPRVWSSSCCSTHSGIAASAGRWHFPRAHRSCRDCIHFISSLPPSPTCAAKSSDQKYCRSRKSDCKAPGNEVVPQINNLCLSTEPT